MSDAIDTDAAVRHIYTQLNDLLSEGQADPQYPDSDVASWRMCVIIRWWLRQMGEATDHDARRVMAVLVEALKEMGIMAEAIPIALDTTEPTVQ